MKTKLLIAAVAFFMLQQSNAQEYIPTAVEGAHWIVRLYDKTQPNPVENLWEYYADGDTIITDVSYKKIYKRSLVVTQEEPPFEADGPYELYGFIRDDSTDRKVYAIEIDEHVSECPTNEEYLMYDFSVNVGDTAVFCLFPEFYDPTITSITPEIYLGFETRVFATEWGFISYYEGMGSDFGLFEMMFDPVKTENRKNLYVTGLYYYCRESPCDLLISTPEIDKISEFNVSPNPSSSFLHFNTGNSTTCEAFVLHNLQGEKIKEVILKSGENKYVLNIQDVAPGLYIALLIDKDIVIKRQKVVITK